MTHTTPTPITARTQVQNLLPASPRLVAAWLFVLAALDPLFGWILLLFVAQPSDQTLISAASETVKYVFSDTNNNRIWFFGWLALAPALLVVSALHMRRAWHQHLGTRSLFFLSLSTAAYSLLFSLVSAILSAAGALLAFLAPNDA